MATALSGDASGAATPRSGAAAGSPPSSFAVGAASAAASAVAALPQTPPEEQAIFAERCYLRTVANIDTGSFVKFDIATGILFELDDKYACLDELAPLGPKQHLRKTLRCYCEIRHQGYYYALVLRHMASLFPKCHWRHKCYTKEYSDETLREIVEALLGAAACARHGYMTSTPENIAILNEYTDAIENCVLTGEQVIRELKALGYWKDTKFIAELLL